ncbi:MAG TPA: DUF2723 domain-containing protein [Blastocatellia bacterium]|nr:DUF2723 domain-containing protein [Blastocatellia bacterium]
MADPKVDPEKQTARERTARGEKARIAVAAAVFVASLATYYFTLAPTVTFVDSGELIAAAHTLGVAHPPGTPLYILLAHLAQLVPIGNVAARVNFASALFAAAAAVVVALVVGELLRSSSAAAQGEKKRRPKQSAAERKAEAARKAEADERWSRYSETAVLAAMLGAGLLFAFSRTLWAYATIAEVYTLNVLLATLIIFLMFRWRRRAKEEGGNRLLYAAAFLFGLAMGVHHVTIVLMLPALAYLVYSTAGAGFFKSKGLMYAALFAFAGLAIYAYLPLAASRSPILNWGDPRTFERFWWHVTGRQYQTFFSLSLTTMAGQFEEFIRFAANQFGPWWSIVGLALAVIGLAAMIKRNRAAFFFFAFIVVADLAVALNYDIAEDKDAYYLPIFVSMAVACGFGVEWLIRTILRTKLPLTLARAAAAVAVLVAVAVTFAGNLPHNDRSRYHLARDYVENVFSTIEPGAMLLTLDWQIYSPLLYVSEVEGHHRDVIAIDVNQMRRSWYFDYLSRSYPSVIEQNREKVDAFLEDLRSWEQDPKAYERNMQLATRIDSRFRDLILSMISNYLRTAPVYVTHDVLAIYAFLAEVKRTNRDMQPAAYHQDGNWIVPLGETYQLIPQGLVFELKTDRVFHEPARPALLTRGLADGTLRFDRDDVVRQKVLPAYLGMFVNRGRYLAAHGRREQAIESFNDALALDPNYAPARQNLDMINRAAPR